MAVSTVLILAVVVACFARQASLIVLGGILSSVYSMYHVTSYWYVSFFQKHIYLQI